jgi:hypothetical protein
MCRSAVCWVKTRGNLGWLWVSVPTMLAWASLRSYPALQFLSAMLLFTAFCVIFVFLIVLLLLVFAVLGYLIEWGMTALTSSVHSVLTSIRDAMISSPSTCSLSHADSLPNIKRNRPASPVLRSPN